MTLDALDLREIDEAVRRGIKRGERAAELAAARQWTGRAQDAGRDRAEGVVAELARAGFLIVRGTP